MAAGERTDVARILVVDDEASIVDAVATSLRYEGFQVEEARSGREALEAVERFKPDLLILDLRLPDIGGLEVSRRLRERGVEAPILFLSATGALDEGAHALREGGNDCVTKPFSLDEISVRAHAMLESAGPRPRPRSSFSERNAAS